MAKFTKSAQPNFSKAEQGLDQAWDNQYWSLWITNNGGGTFKDIWTANTYATDGLYVSNTSTPSRYHANFDRAVVNYPDSAFMAPDGVTIIPETYDIGRCAALSAAIMGQPFYVSDEIPERTVQVDVGVNGKLSNVREVHSQGGYSTAVDKDGNLYIAAGQIFMYDKSGKEINRINIPERPISITFGGKDGNTLFASTQTSLYSVKVK